jgi:hypothetical protein
LYTLIPGQNEQCFLGWNGYMSGMQFDKEWMDPLDLGRDRLRGRKGTAENEGGLIL